MDNTNLFVPTLPEPTGGWEARDARLAKERAEAETRRREKLELDRRRALVKLGVPVKDVERICVHDLKPTKALEALQGDWRLFVLSGGYGCGKTTAAAWWVTQPGPASPYLDTTDPMFIPTAKLERYTRYNAEDMLRLERARRLVIDDLGHEFLDKKEYFLTAVRAIVDSRYQDCLPLLMTTNKTHKEFASIYGERVIDRIREVGKFVEINAPSMRRQAGGIR